MISAVISEAHVFSVLYYRCKGEAWPQGEPAAGERQQNGAGNKGANADVEYGGQGSAAV